MAKQPAFTTAALENLEETGWDWELDVERLRANLISFDVLKEACLLGADDDRVPGWCDYIDALEAFIVIPDDEAACRADHQMDQERDDRLTGDR